MNNKHIIFILDDVPEIIEILTSYFDSICDDYEIYGFTDYNKLLNHPLLPNVSLGIFDIKLPGIRGCVVADKIKNKLNINFPFLFMSGEPYKFKDFSKYNFTYDYISKPITNYDSFCNRVRVLLQVSTAFKQHQKERLQLQLSLKDLFNFTNIYMLILDSNMKVKMCSYKLAKDLGYKSEQELLNLNWEQFIAIEEIKRIKEIHKHILKKDDKYEKQFREVSNKIIKKNKDTIEVKWFNSQIKNGATYSFSIGIPYNRTVSADDDIDTIRAYWKHIIDKDKTTLKALKDVV